MPNVNDLKKSSFLKKEDCGAGILVTIKAYEQINTAKEGAPEEIKWALIFDELEKPMVLNSTNGQIIEKITGSGDFDNWIGHKVVLYDDPNVSFAGRITGGIRVRAPKTARPAAPSGGRADSVRPPTKLSAPADLDSEDIPF